MQLTLWYKINFLISQNLLAILFITIWILFPLFKWPTPTISSSEFKNSGQKCFRPCKEITSKSDKYLPYPSEVLIRFIRNIFYSTIILHFGREALNTTFKSDLIFFYNLRTISSGRLSFCTGSKNIKKSGSSKVVYLPVLLKTYTRYMFRSNVFNFNWKERTKSAYVETYSFATGQISYVEKSLRITLLYLLRRMKINFHIYPRLQWKAEFFFATMVSVLVGLIISLNFDTRFQTFVLTKISNFENNIFVKKIKRIYHLCKYIKEMEVGLLERWLVK